ncbi:Armadillo repeat-containing protein 1 [Geodia barretti]|uniref:Armadillo repeat-containing protein 1 n=3 Tax=Geodia barretti TaxID=519541 RepID=A0AA35RHX8_GEOBA|nr:Armadillo repeat-containing protein 1 [Geodia barretti]
MDVLKVVQQLRDLAADPQNRATIVRDQGCLPGLVIFLDNDNPDVVLTALEALFYLAQVPSNRPLMKNEMGLLISVRRIINRQQSLHELKSSAQKVHDLLIHPSGSARPSSHSRHGASRSNSFLGSSNRRAKTIILQVEGLNDEESRLMIEERLLTVRGVISFTFNMPRHRCVVRVRSDIKPEVLCRAVESSGTFGAQQVVKSERGEEKLLAFGPGSPAKGGKENTPVKMPEYLPEGTETDKTDDKAVERSGAVGGAGGWFGGVKRYLSDTFYW